MSEHEDNHGHSPAAWTAVVIMMVGVVLGGLGIILGSWPMFWIGGIAVIVVGAIVGKVMALMGYGVAGAHRVDAPEQSAA